MISVTLFNHVFMQCKMLCPLFLPDTLHYSFSKTDNPYLAGSKFAGFNPPYVCGDDTLLKKIFFCIRLLI